MFGISSNEKKISEKKSFMKWDWQWKNLHGTRKSSALEDTATNISVNEEQRRGKAKKPAENSQQQTGLQERKGEQTIPKLNNSQLNQAELKQSKAKQKTQGVL